MQVSEAVGKTLAELGADTVFGVVGSGNFHVTNALIEGGANYVAARHEGGAATMADAWARLTGRVGVLTVHQGPGLTNAMTGIAEAAKSGTALLVLAGEAPSPRSNFYINVAHLAAAVGAAHDRLHSPGTAVDDVQRAYRTASGGRPVIMAMPLDVQAAEVKPGQVAPAPVRYPPAPAPAAVAELAALLRSARRPVFIAGRGARGAREPLERLAGQCGALLATSAVAKGLFGGNPWDLDISGGFATPLAAELICGADLVVAWGCSLTMWTTRRGDLIRGLAVQVDDDQSAIGVNRPVNLGVLGDVTLTATAVAKELDDGLEEPGRVPHKYRSADLRQRIATEGTWRAVPFSDESDGSLIDPRLLSAELDDLFPAERTVAIDSGNFMGYPAMYLSVPDADGFCFTQGFQSIGLGLASAIGAAIARPDRLTIAALGDGGALMSVSELETAARLGLRLAAVVYDDAAYGAEVHHFSPGGHNLAAVTFPDADIAAIARGFGWDAITVRGKDDLAPVRDWVSGGCVRPLLIDAKVTSAHGAWWLEEAFRGH